MNYYSLIIDFLQNKKLYTFYVNNNIDLNNYQYILEFAFNQDHYYVILYILQLYYNNFNNVNINIYFNNHILFNTISSYLNDYYNDNYDSDECDDYYFTWYNWEDIKNYELIYSFLIKKHCILRNILYMIYKIDYNSLKCYEFTISFDLSNLHDNRLNSLNIYSHNDSNNENFNTIINETINFDNIDDDTFKPIIIKSHKKL